MRIADRKRRVKRRALRLVASDSSDDQPQDRALRRPARHESPQLPITRAMAAVRVPDAWAAIISALLNAESGK